MTSESFVYWLQGLVELQDSDVLSEKQWRVVKDHLKLVFDKKTPDYQMHPSVGGPGYIKYPDATPPHRTFPKIGVSPTFVPPYTITC